MTSTSAQAAHAVYGYVDPMSVAHGEPLIVCCASRGAGTAHVDVYRVVGCHADFTLRLEFVQRCDPVEALRCPDFPDEVPLAPGDADADGCGWPRAEALAAVPDAWPSGLYLAQFATTDQPTGRPSTRLGEDALFVVRQGEPGSTSRILLQVGVATWSAYHIWQSRSLYNADVGDHTGLENVDLRAHRVSLRRPGVGLAPGNNVRRWLPKGRLYVPPFLEWLQAEQIPVELCTGIDIHEGRVPLSAYDLVLTVGHDEYWTTAQRDALEEFVAEGGNAAFFGGNLVYWQVRVEDEGSAVVCFKRSGASHMPGGTPLDPTYRDPGAYPNHDNSLVTVEFFSEPVNRSSISLTGVSMQHDGGLAPTAGADGIHNGAAWWWEDYGGPARPPKGLTVADPDHWALAGTGLSEGATFGEEQKLVGYECDGLDVTWSSGRPVPSGRDGASPKTEIVAFADCRTWAELDYTTDPPSRSEGRRMSPGAVGGFVTMVALSRPGGGEVFTAPVTDWPQALVSTVDYTDCRSAERRVRPASSVVQQITRNVLSRLGRREGSGNKG